MTKPEAPIRLDLNNPLFQEHLLTLQKAERHAALDTLNKIRQLTWNRCCLLSADQPITQGNSASRG